MTVRVLFFSVLRDLSGTDEIAIECAETATLADLLEQLFQRWPKLRDWDRSLLLAIDHAFTKRDAPLHTGAEVALMPPVQGG
jgi:molybdopterin converting factor small subunit